MGVVCSSVASENHSNPLPIPPPKSIATKAKSKHFVIETYIGRYIRAANRFHAPVNSAGIEILNSKGEMDEDVLTELINGPDVWAGFSFQEKKEFTFIALIYGQLQGGGLTTLLILLDREAIPIATELGEISDKTLTEDFSLDQEGRERFRHRIKFLKDELKPLKMPSLN
jgi:hypothetical protein